MEPLQEMSEELMALRLEVARLQEQIRGNSTALDLARQELHRRLEDLNHAHRDAQTKEATFLSVERFEEFVRANALWRESVMVTLAANSGKWGAYAATFATALALAGLIIQFMHR